MRTSALTAFATAQAVLAAPIFSRDASSQCPATASLPSPQAGCYPQIANFDDLSPGQQLEPGYDEAGWSNFWSATPSTVASHQAHVVARSGKSHAFVKSTETGVLTFSTVQDDEFPFGNAKSLYFGCAVPSNNPSAGFNTPVPCNMTVKATCLNSAVASKTEPFATYTAQFTYKPSAGPNVPMQFANIAAAKKPANAEEYCVQYEFSATSSSKTAPKPRLLIDDLAFNLYYGEP